jgi:hypothetical protein
MFRRTAGLYTLSTQQGEVHLRAIIRRSFVRGKSLPTVPRRDMSFPELSLARDIGPPTPSERRIAIDRSRQPRRSGKSAGRCLASLDSPIPRILCYWSGGIEADPVRGPRRAPESPVRTKDSIHSLNSLWSLNCPISDWNRQRRCSDPFSRGGPIARGHLLCPCP